MKRGIVLAASLLIVAPASAQDSDQQKSPPAHLRELCSERPGLTTAACTVDPGHVQIEFGVANWTLDRQSDEREDRIEGSDILLRYGLTATTEVQLGWPAFGHVRTRDKMDGTVEHSSGIGDVSIGLKWNLRHPAEGKTGLAAAILPYATLPTGRREVGEGDWGAGLVLPLSYKFNDTLSLALSPEIDAAVDEDRSGRHLAYGAAAAVQVHLSETIRLSPEIQVIRDDDPQKSVTLSSASLSLDVRSGKMTQFDVQAVAGLNRDTPDVKLSCGVTHKF